MATELGIEAATLPLLISVYFWFAMLGKIIFGWMGDRYDKCIVMLNGVVFLVAGLTFMRYYGANGLFLYAAIYGVGFGGTFTMIQLLIAQFYSGAHYGKILGMLTMIDVAAGGLGIPAMALLQQGFGSYMPVLEILIMLTLIIGLSVVVFFQSRKLQESQETRDLSHRFKRS
ncbi:MAG: MFS transporter [Pseudohongiellaceae bacterium]